MLEVNQIKDIGRRQFQVPPVLLDIAGLHIAEAGYRECLQTQPDNTAARLNLAWCLFVQALHRGGIESVCMVEADQPVMAPIKCSRATGERNSSALLQECLGHAFMVRNLSVGRKDIQDAQRLQALVRLSGLQDAAKSAEAQSMDWLIALSCEIMYGTNSDSK